METFGSFLCLPGGSLGGKPGGDGLRHSEVGTDVLIFVLSLVNKSVVQYIGSLRPLKTKYRRLSAIKVLFWIASYHKTHPETKEQRPPPTQGVV